MVKNARGNALKIHLEKMYATGNTSCYPVCVSDTINLLSLFDTANNNKDPPTPPTPTPIPTANLHLIEKSDSEDSDVESDTSQAHDWSLVSEEVEDRSSIIAAAIAAPALADYHLDSEEDDFVDCEGIYEEDEIKPVICMVQAEEEDGSFGSFDESESVYWREDDEPAVVCSTLSFGPDDNVLTPHCEDNFIDPTYNYNMQS